MLKIASTLSECLTKPIDLILSHTGINLRENASTFLVKTNLSYITKAFFNNIKKKKIKIIVTPVLTLFSIWDKYLLR